jgi:Fe2+ transport system protein FeoA
MESPDSRRRRGLLLLANAEAGKNYRVSGIYERDRRLLEFLEARGIRPGARLNIVERNYDKTLTLTSEAGTIALGGTAAEKVWVAAAERPARRSLRAT